MWASVPVWNTTNNTLYYLDNSDSLVLYRIITNESQEKKFCNKDFQEKVPWKSMSYSDRTKYQRNHNVPPAITTEENLKHLPCLLKKLFHSPESHRGDLSHEGICSNTLKVKQGAICQQQQHDVLAVAEALPTPANHRDILRPKQKNILVACVSLLCLSCHCSEKI